MLQRNVGPYPRTFPTLDPPLELGPGDVVDHPDPLAGCEPVVEEAPGEVPVLSTAVPAADPAPTTPGRRAKASAALTPEALN